MTRFEKGLFEVADGVHAYIQPDGSWGWSNAGLLVGDDTSLLVDTLFDLELTASMLHTMSSLTASARIRSVVNTHANGDHCYGNQLLAGGDVEFIASAAAAAELSELPASRLAGIVANAPPGPVRDFVEHAFGPFHLEGIEVPPISSPFSGRRQLTIGSKRVELIEVGPAHTAGDVIVWAPDDRVVFTGDILFIGGTPIMWTGPVSNWIAACELIDELQPAVVVPGHGPMTDATGARDVAEYLRYIEHRLIEQFQDGRGFDEAVRDLDASIDSTRFGSWSDRERLVVTAHHIWKDVDPAHEIPNAMTLFAQMAARFATPR